MMNADQATPENLYLTGMKGIKGITPFNQKKGLWF
jgi:hypothetical protein